MIINNEVKCYETLNNHMEPFSSENSEEYNKTITSDKVDKKKKRKYHKKSEIQISVSTKSEECASITSISKDDLEELRLVYRKCKAVMRRIETKYGHLLNLIESLTDHSNETIPDEDNKCECSFNRKIVFDEDGQVTAMEAVLVNHICPKKLKRKLSDTNYANNLQVEYDTAEIELPDDIQTLSIMLQNPEIEITHRSKIINKIKSIKQEFIDEMKFNKKSLVEKVKSNPDEVFEFKGTNLNSLPGYLY